MWCHRGRAEIRLYFFVFVQSTQFVPSFLSYPSSLSSLCYLGLSVGRSVLRTSTLYDHCLISWGIREHAENSSVESRPGFATRRAMWHLTREPTAFWCEQFFLCSTSSDTNNNYLIAKKAVDVGDDAGRCFRCSYKYVTLSYSFYMFLPLFLTPLLERRVCDLQGSTYLSRLYLL